MKTVSKRRAMTTYRQHSVSRTFRYYIGRYQWRGSVCYYIGQVVPDIPGVLAAYAERCQDCNGPYAYLTSTTPN